MAKAYCEEFRESINGSRCYEVNTLRTFTKCMVEDNGAGFVRVIRDGKVLLYFQFGPEDHEKIKGGNNGE